MLRRGTCRAHTGLAILLTGVAVAAAAVHASWLHLPVVDDAAISLAYGRSLYSGAGLRLTPRSAAVEGFSSPLWVALTGLAFPLRAEPLSFARWLGIALGVVALALVPVAVAAAHGGPVDPVDAAGPLLVASVHSYAVWISSGMESGLYALLLVASCWALVRGFRLGRGAAAGAILGLLALTRPEAPLSIAAATGALGVWLFLSRRAPGRPERTLALTLALICGAYLVFRWVYFARLLPNTYLAKRSWNFGALQYLLGFVRSHAAPLGVCLALGLVGLTSRATRKAVALALLFLLCGAAFACWARGDWMGEWRFLNPLWPLLGILVVGGLRALQEHLAPSRWRALPAALAVLAVGVVLASEAGLHRVARGSPGLAAEFVRREATRLRMHLDTLGIVHARVGVPDVGGTGLELRRDRIVDLAGLADYAMAEHADNLRAIEDYLVGEGLPDVLDLHGPSRRLDGLWRVLDHYAWSDAGLWELSGLGPGHDPRCPDGEVAPIADAEPDALVAELQGLIDRDAPDRAILLVRCAQAHRREDVGTLQRALLAASAVRSADRLENAGQPERALRHLSLATILASEDAHLRRRTELLRGRLFPSTPGSPDDDDR